MDIGAVFLNLKVGIGVGRPRDFSPLSTNLTCSFSYRPGSKSQLATRENPTVRNKKRPQMTAF